MSAPALRFKQDDGRAFPEWNLKLLGRIATFSKGKGISKADIDANGTTLCIRYGELYTEYGETIREVKSKTSVPEKNLILSEVNDVIIPASGETQIDIATASCVQVSGVALGGDLNIIKCAENGVFLSYYLNSQKKLDIAKLAQGNSVVHLYSSQLKLLDINLPSKQEQSKIANFLTAVDEKITQLTQKHNLLNKYKKGVMQQIFSQELRFKDKDSQDFPEWGERVLGDLFSITSSKRVFQNEWTKSGIPFYRAREVVKLSENGFVDNELFISTEMYNEYKTKYGVPQENDLLVTGVGTIGILYVVKADERFYFKDGNIIWLKTLNIVNSQFVSQLFKSPIIKKQIDDNASITTVGTYTIDSAKKTVIPFPCLKEQAKIANFLTAIDDKITITKAQLDAAKQYKQGLLQQMFV